jgi:transposase
MKKTKKKEKNLQVINANAAGIDIGASKHYVAVSSQKDERPIREFGATTSELEKILNWLKTLEITTVAMESTGIYWISLYDILESNGIEVYLVNAKSIKNVSGRKTDVSDCEWIRKLHSYGLLSRSFVPEELTRKLRSYVRQRESMEILKAQDLTRMSKVLHIMNIKLRNVVSDLEGVVAMNIVRDIASGVTSAKELLKHWNKQMQTSCEEAKLALEGNYKEENIFVLEQTLSSYDFHKRQMLECDQKIEEVLQQMSAISKQEEEKQEAAQEDKKKPKKKVRKNKYSFEAREYLKKIIGVDLTAVDGFDVNTIITIISEVGTDMSRFKTSKHFVSWLRLCPNAKISGGKIIGYNKNTTSNRASKAFRLAAQSLNMSKCYLGEYYRKISYKRGSQIAIKAVGRKLAVIYYKMITKEKEYYRIESELLQEKTKKRMLKNLEKNAKKLGYIIVKEAS